MADNPNTEIDLMDGVFSTYQSWFNQFSPAQIALGLQAVFDPNYSNLGFCFQESSIDEDKAIRVIESLGNLVLSKFETSAPEKICHLNEEAVGHENEIVSQMVYMFWDTSSIPHKCSSRIQTACFEVMMLWSQSQNIALVESGLHGLGHAVQEYGQDRLMPYFDRVNVQRSPHLRNYAQRAMNGSIV